MIREFSIDPWICMAPLGLVEFMKANSDAENATDHFDVTTRSGYQPMVDNPIEWPQLAQLKYTLIPIINETLDCEWKFHRSWFVSYNKGGSQSMHNHAGSDYSIVVNLMSSKFDGLLEFEDGEVFDLPQGGGVIFDSNLRHRGCTVFYPKTVVAIDIKKIDQ